MWWVLAALAAYLYLRQQQTLGLDGQGHVTSYVGQADLGAPSYSPYEAPAVATGPAPLPAIGAPIYTAAPVASGSANPGGAVAAAVPLVKTAVGIFSGGAGAAGATSVASTVATGTVPGALGEEALAQPAAAASLPALEAAAIPFAAVGAFKTLLTLLNPTIGVGDPRANAAAWSWGAAYNSYLTANGVNPNAVQVQDPTGAIQAAARQYANATVPAAVGTPDSAPGANVLIASAGDRER